MNCDGLHDVKEHLANIDGKLEVYNELLAHHIKRTDQMEDYVKEQNSNNSKIIDKIIQQSDKNQAALNKQLKISLGVFAALAALVSALAAWLS